MRFILNRMQFFLKHILYMVHIIFFITIISVYPSYMSTDFINDFMDMGGTCMRPGIQMLMFKILNGNLFLLKFIYAGLLPFLAFTTISRAFFKKTIFQIIGFYFLFTVSLSHCFSYSNDDVSFIVLLISLGFFCLYLFKNKKQWYLYSGLVALFFFSWVRLNNFLVALPIMAFFIPKVFVEHYKKSIKISKMKFMILLSSSLIVFMFSVLIILRFSLGKSLTPFDNLKRVDIFLIEAKVGNIDSILQKKYQSSTLVKDKLLKIASDKHLPGNKELGVIYKYLKISYSNEKYLWTIFSHFDIYMGIKLKRLKEEMSRPLRKVHFFKESVNNYKQCLVPFKTSNMEKYAKLRKECAVKFEDRNQGRLRVELIPENKSKGIFFLIFLFLAVYLAIKRSVFSSLENTFLFSLSVSYIAYSFITLLLVVITHPRFFYLLNAIQIMMICLFLNFLYQKFTMRKNVKELLENS